MKAKFVVLEGIDGSGTTTQSELLVRHLNGRGIRSERTCEPTDLPVGRYIRQILRGEEPPRSWDTMALLFAADRMDHVENIRAAIGLSNTTIVSDRFTFSSVIYQSTTSPYPELALDWIRKINNRAGIPDLTLILDVAPHVAKERREARRQKPELFDEEVLQTKLAAQYQWVKEEPNVKHVDANGTIEETFEKILVHVLRLFGMLRLS